MQYALDYSGQVQDFCPLKIKITQFPGGFHSCMSDQEARGGLPYETDGNASDKFWILPLKETIWAWLKLFVTPKGDQSLRGLSKFCPLKETASFIVTD